MAVLPLPAASASTAVGGDIIDFMAPSIAVVTLVTNTCVSNFVCSRVSSRLKLHYTQTRGTLCRYPYRFR